MHAKYFPPMPSIFISQVFDFRVHSLISPVATKHSLDFNLIFLSSHPVNPVIFAITSSFEVMGFGVNSRIVSPRQDFLSTTFIVFDSKGLPKKPIFFSDRVPVPVIDSIFMLYFPLGVFSLLLNTNKKFSSISCLIL